MEINTKLNPGDIAWYIHHDEVHSATVLEIEILAVDPTQVKLGRRPVALKVLYSLGDSLPQRDSDRKPLQLLEDRVFTSKFQLVASL